MIAGLNRALKIVETEIARAESLIAVEEDGRPVFDPIQTGAGIAALEMVAAMIRQELCAAIRQG